MGIMMCDLDSNPKVKVKGKKPGICDARVPLTAALVMTSFTIVITK